MFDVTVIGGGPAGLAAAIEAKKTGAQVLLIEREAALGGILKQCVHDGFGLARFGERLTGPEYAERFVRQFHELGIESMLQAFVTAASRGEDGVFRLSVVTSGGIRTVETRTIVLATGCRERTAQQVAIHGTRPAGVITAGAAQHYVNLMGVMPARRAVILGSGDIGLIMARRLTLEGAQVLGVYEILPKPSGLARNISQCLNDFHIPLTLSHTVTRVFGVDRLEAVEVAAVDEKLRPIPGTEQRIACDTLLLSVGLIPENELAEKLGVKLDAKTKGPVTDETLQTTVPGIFTCGNSQRVFDLVDKVSDSGEAAGHNAALHARGDKNYVNFKQPKSEATAQRPIEKDEIVCIVCPNSCVMKVDPATGEVTGNRCQRGAAFAVNERTHPMRTVTTTVRTVFSECPVLPVRTAGEVPKDRVTDVMAAIDRERLDRRVGAGDVVIPNVLGLGVDVVSASGKLKGEAVICEIR